MQDNNENTIVLDMNKVTSRYFKESVKSLRPRLHINTPEENAQLELDLLRSKIILDINGKRTSCSSIKEFQAAATMLSGRQKQYILNVGHQGLFGGGSAFIPTQNTTAQQGILLRDTRNRLDNEGSMSLTSDTPLCVSIKDDKVALTNTIDFSMISPEDQDKKLGSLTLSMIADITNLVQSKGQLSSTQIQEMPIYMTISHQNKPADVEIINNFRTLERNAEVTGATKTNITDLIQQVRDNTMHDNIMHGQNINSLIQMVKELADKSLDNSKPLLGRQENLDNILGKSTFTIEEQSSPYEVASKILSARASPDKDKIRLNYAAHAITEYAASFDNQHGQNPSAEVVSKIFGAVVEDDKTKKILQQNSGMILRQTTYNSNLSFKDRVKKVFDNIAMIIMPKKQAVKSFVAALKAERKQSHARER